MNYKCKNSENDIVKSFKDNLEKYSSSYWSEIYKNDVKNSYKNASNVFFDEIYKNIDTVKLNNRNEKQFKDQPTISQAEKFSQKMHESTSNLSFEIVKNIYREWKIKENKEITERKETTKTLIEILKIQIGVNIGILFSQGLGVLDIESNILIAYFSVFAVELIGIVIIMMQYLYNERSKEPLQIIKEILIGIGNNNIEIHNRGIDTKYEAEKATK